jgi:hypothetical protein
LASTGGIRNDDSIAIAAKKVAAALESIYNKGKAVEELK